MKLMKSSIYVGCTTLFLDASTLLIRSIYAFVDGQSSLGMSMIVYAAFVAMISAVLLNFACKIPNDYFARPNGKTKYNLFTTILLVIGIMFALIATATLLEAIKDVCVVCIVFAGLEILSSLATIVMSVILYKK